MMQSWVAAGGPRVPRVPQGAVEDWRSAGDSGGSGAAPAGIATSHRVAEREYRTEELADVRFVPLVGVEGWTQGRRAIKAPDGTPAEPERVFRDLPLRERR